MALAPPAKAGGYRPGLQVGATSPSGAEKIVLVAALFDDRDRAL